MTISRGLRLRFELMAHGLKAADLAARLGVQEPHVSRLLHGGLERARPQTRLRVERAVKEMVKEARAREAAERAQSRQPLGL